MRQDKERSIREQADLWKGYWCILACILLVGRVSYLTFFQNHIVSVYAAAQTEQKEDSSVQILQENLMEEIQIDDVQKMLDEIMDDHVFSVREALMNIINGEEPVSKETVRSFLYSLFFSDIENEKGLILKLLLVIFIAAVTAFPMPGIALAALPTAERFMASITGLTIFRTICRPTIAPRRVFNPQFTATSKSSAIFVSISSFDK